MIRTYNVFILLREVEVKSWPVNKSTKIKMNENVQDEDVKLSKVRCGEEMCLVVL